MESNVDYDLLPKLENIGIPILVVHGDHDLIPSARVAAIARALPRARVVTLSEYGRFSHLECPDEVRREVVEFLGGAA